MNKKIRSALISVYHKQGLESLLLKLHDLGVQLISTGGTYDYIRSLGLPALTVESLTDYPAILGGRVKTLHPAVFGGILARSDNPQDQNEINRHGINPIDLVLVDLYPFEETLQNTTEESDIIEKIDIGGISLIRAAAKNYKDVLVVPAAGYYSEFEALLSEENGTTTLADRKRFASYAFEVSSRYDAAIYGWMSENSGNLRLVTQGRTPLRYGENPHQQGAFHGRLDQVFEQLSGKAVSYNNILDLDAGLGLIAEFDEPALAILKHNNACGLACRPTMAEAYQAALACDPLSAFGGVLVANRSIDADAAQAMHELFFEVLAAPDFSENALSILKQKKNRIILQYRAAVFPTKVYRSALNGLLEQDRDNRSASAAQFNVVTQKAPDERETSDLVFAAKAVKHARSNAIVLARDGQLLGSGAGHTSRVDALRHAISKAVENGFELHGAVLASDAFFPFSDSIELAAQYGISAVVQPGGSLRDQDSIDACNQNGISMVFTGLRHFKH
ncbi:MAG TPA: bifunctional phosphoribosylaminoimidazolecarboxamide formyltransferase/IMP cyclohydrolase [Bacteroidales bacterium]|nr:bifunctional phosphoribosylaminoimidazolecarboxamide formyltransferase/IMP cyclohydrolase [Bacteroidales bacterium]